MVNVVEIVLLAPIVSRVSPCTSAVNTALPAVAAVPVKTIVTLAPLSNVLLPQVTMAPLVAQVPADEVTV